MLVTGRYEGAGGLFVHPVDNDRVMAGNGTIGLELLEQLARLRHGRRAVRRRRPGDGDRERRQGRAPGGADRRRRARDGRAGRRDARSRARRPRSSTRRRSSTAPGSRELIPRVWEQASQLLDAAYALPLDEVAAAVRADRRARPRDRRGRRCPRGRDGAVEPPRGREEGRLHRLGRQHRPGRAEPDPGRRAAVNVDAVRARSRRCGDGFAYFDAPGWHAGAGRGRPGGRRRDARCVRQSRRAVRDRPRGRGDPRAREGRRRAVPRLHGRRDLVRDEHDDARLRDLARRGP